MKMRRRSYHIRICFLQGRQLQLQFSRSSRRTVKTESLSSSAHQEFKCRGVYHGSSGRRNKRRLNQKWELDASREEIGWLFQQGGTDGWESTTVFCIQQLLTKKKKDHFKFCRDLRTKGKVWQFLNRHRPWATGGGGGLFIKLVCHSFCPTLLSSLTQGNYKADWAQIFNEAFPKFGTCR